MNKIDKFGLVFEDEEGILTFENFTIEVAKGACGVCAILELLINKLNKELEIHKKSHA